MLFLGAQLRLLDVVAFTSETRATMRRSFSKFQFATPQYLRHFLSLNHLLLSFNWQQLICDAEMSFTCPGDQN